MNGVVATIFGVYGGAQRGRPDYRRMSPVGPQPGAAGYIMYGPSTILVYTTGSGVHGFTLDHDIGEFLLTHPDIRCPEAGAYYSDEGVPGPLFLAPR